MAHTALFLLLAAALLPAQPARFGLPACSPSHQELADHAFFLLCHDPALKVSRWVAYELLPQHHHLSHPRPFVLSNAVPQIQSVSTTNLITNVLNNS